MKPLITISFLFIAFSAFAQDQKSQISKPLDIGLKGWNRVLYMNNGNTILFHFEPSHMIEVKVFDSARKEKTGKGEKYNVLYSFSTNPPVIKGVFEINGEAVLFIDQEINSKHCLIRLRYDAASGRLIEEKMIAVDKLSKSPRDESAVRIRSRCQICGRPRAVYKKFGLCRIHLREAAMRGDVPGLVKASW